MANKNFYTSYSAIKTFEKCPQTYKWTYIYRRNPEKEHCKYHSISGTVIQKLFEYFYNDQYYLKGKNCTSFMIEKLEEIYRHYIQKIYVDWSNAPKTKIELFEEIKTLVPMGIKIIKDHRLIGEYNRSEKRVTMFIQSNKINGYIDFIIIKNNELIILDGKDVKAEKKIKYLDDDQLKLYALIFARQHKRVASKIGFLCWRLDKIEWVDFKNEDLEKIEKNFNSRIWRIRDAIDGGNLKATPSKNSCIFCKYRDECPDVYKDPVIDTSNGLATTEF